MKTKTKHYCGLCRRRVAVDPASLEAPQLCPACVAERDAIANNKTKGKTK